MTDPVPERPYWELAGFEHLYFEDSYLLSVEEGPDALEFKMLLVLAERHPAYRPPLPGEQFCYRHGTVRFVRPRCVVWRRRSFTPIADPDGSIDYGAIDRFECTPKSFSLSGDWGDVELDADSVNVSLE